MFWSGCQETLHTSLISFFQQNISFRFTIFPFYSFPELTLRRDLTLTLMSVTWIFWPHLVTGSPSSFHFPRNISGPCFLGCRKTLESIFFPYFGRCLCGTVANTPLRQPTDGNRFDQCLSPSSYFWLHFCHCGPRLQPISPVPWLQLSATDESKRY